MRFKDQQPLHKASLLCIWSGKLSSDLGVCLRFQLVTSYSSNARQAKSLHITAICYNKTIRNLQVKITRESIKRLWLKTTSTFSYILFLRKNLNLEIHYTSRRPGARGLVPGDRAETSAAYLLTDTNQLRKIQFLYNSRPI